MREGRLLRSLSWLALLTCVVVSFGPIALMVLSSFKLEKDIFTFVPKLVFEPVPDHYQRLLREWPTFFAALGNSALVTVAAAALVVATSLPAAYAYSRLARGGVTLTALFLIGVRMFPPIIITVPLFPIFTELGLIDTPIVLILVYAAFQVSMSVLLLKAFIDGVPRELEEAAWIDGCSRTQGFVRIVAPNIVPGLIASVIFVALFAWNDFLFALIFTGTSAKTAPVLVAELLGSVGIWDVDWGMVFAAATIQLLPMLLFVWIIQQPMLRGFMTGALKG